MLLFFTQKTAYEMRIRDGSSDVCSSDLVAARQRDERRVGHRHLPRQHRRKRRRAARFDDKVQLFERQPHRIAHLDSRHHDTLDAPRLEYREIDRSEEHTSELQSLMRISYAVFCLKKKTNDQLTSQHNHHTHNT